MHGFELLKYLFLVADCDLMRQSRLAASIINAVLIVLVKEIQLNSRLPTLY